MIPNYNMYPQQMQQLGYLGSQASINAACLKGRLVTSIDEVKAAPIDFDGSIFYFPDQFNNLIYTKQVNMDGTVAIKAYELRQTPVTTTTNYVTREELDSILTQFKNNLMPPQNLQNRCEF